MSGSYDPAVSPSAPSKRGDRSDRSAATHQLWEMPLLAARPGGFADRFAQAAPSNNPIVVFFLTAVTGLLLLGAISIAVGFIVTELVLDLSFVRSADAELPEWMADNRTSTLTDISLVGSEIAGRVVLPILVGVVAVVFAVMRKWRTAAFAVFVLLVESATYRVTSFANARDRPDVRRLEDLTADASFPSGHTAAAIAVYAGLVLLITSRFTDSRLRAALWTAAVTIATVVALSRMYRGMHHPIDIVAGVLIGCASIAVLVFACRAAASVVRTQEAELPQPQASAPQRQPAT